MTVMITTTIHPKTRLRGKDNRLCRIRYRYKEALPHEKRAYGDRTGYLSQHGVIEYLQRLRRPNAPATQERLQPARVNEAACIMGATIHTAATDTMSKHRRGVPRKPGTHGRMSEQKSKGSALEQASRNPTARNHCTPPRDQQVWDRINSMRPTGAGSGIARAAAEGKITLVRADGVEEVFGRYGGGAIARAVREHTELIAKHDVLDPEFNRELARDVEQATSEILASIKGGNPIAAGRTSAELDRLNSDPPVEAEVEAAKDRMRQSEDGAPGLDGIMAWMLLWAHASLPSFYLSIRSLIEALLLLFVIVWEFQSIPAAWLMVLMVYMAKGCPRQDSHSLVQTTLPTISTRETIHARALPEAQNYPEGRLPVRTNGLQGGSRI